jgi:hypothetical protein
MIQRFRKGKRVYTHWDKKTEQVTIVPGKARAAVPAANVTVEVPAECQNGRHADIFLIRHTSEEFVIDCAGTLPGQRAAKVAARVILNPFQAKKLAAALEKELHD